jgi:hypothetical protein
MDFFSILYPQIYKRYAWHFISVRASKNSNSSSLVKTRDIGTWSHSGSEAWNIEQLIQALRWKHELEDSESSRWKLSGNKNHVWCFLTNCDMNAVRVVHLHNIAAGLLWPLTTEHNSVVLYITWEGWVNILPQQPTHTRLSPLWIGCDMVLQYYKYDFHS